MTREISISQGLSVLVDDEDFELVTQYRWHSAKRPNTIYAVRRFFHCERKTTQYMHSLITGWLHVDHINNDGLDNRKENLRKSTHTQNQANTPKRRVGTSKYKGVSWHKIGKRWQAQIKKEYTKINLGLYDSEEEAAKAYDRKALELFGEFAQLNFHQEEEIVHEPV